MADRCEYAALSRHLWQTMIDAMSLKHIRNPMTALRITGPFTALRNGHCNARLRERFLQKILEECPLKMDPQNSFSHLPVLDTLCMCRAHLVVMARASANINGTTADGHQCICDSCSGRIR
jgi:hypothetical protein